MKYLGIKLIINMFLTHMRVYIFAVFIFKNPLNNYFQNDKIKYYRKRKLIFN